VGFRAKELQALGTGGPVKAPAMSGATRVRACSACSGDYEDPERTAWHDASDEDEGAEDASRFVPREGFPAMEK